MAGAAGLGAAAAAATGAATPPRPPWPAAAGARDDDTTHLGRDELTAAGWWSDADDEDDEYDWDDPESAGPSGDRPGPGLPLPPPGPPPRRPSRLKYLVFGLVFVLLLAAVPLLGYTGAQRLLDSRGGTTAVRSKGNPTDPGYEAVVDHTPTALIVQTDDDGAPAGLTLVALGRGDTGGSVIFIPYETMLDRPAFLIDRLSAAYQAGQPDQIANVEQATARLLRISFTETIELSDTRWSEMVAKVAPIPIINPETVRTGDREFPDGPIELAAADVGPYLRARSGEQESDLNRLNRQRLFWEAWISKVTATGQSAIAGETENGVGRLIWTLSQGDVLYEPLPVNPLPKEEGEPQTYFPVVEDVKALITEAVPFPFSSGAGERFTVRVLNGVKGEIVPTSVTDPLIANMAQINVIGNAREFGQETTVIEYYDPANRPHAETAREALGAGEVKLREGVSEPYALTITVGSDVLSAAGTANGSTGSVTTPESEGGGD